MKENSPVFLDQEECISYFLDVRAILKVTFLVVPMFFNIGEHVCRSAIGPI